MKQDYCIIFDYSSNNGGATHVAKEEMKRLRIMGHAVTFISVDGQNKFIFILNILMSNLKIMIYFLFSRKNFIIHTFSFFPIVLLCCLIRPRRFLFVIHDYITICPSKARYNFVKQNICEIEGASLSCLRENCGYAVKKKLVHSLFTMTFRYICKWRNLQIRTLSIKSSKLLGKHLDTVTTVIPNLYVWGMPQKQNLTETVNNKIPYIVFAGRPTKDKGYDRFRRIRSRRYHKVHVGASGINTFSDTYLGWLDPERVKSIVTKAAVIIYPARQIDCDPLIMQLALEYKIPMVVDEKNAAASTVHKFFGQNCVLSNWDNFCIDSLNFHSTNNFNYSHITIEEINKLYLDAFS